jgi:hypothetical protein
MKIKINNQATITEAKPGTIAEITDRLTFANPQYLENQKRDFQNWKTPRTIECFKPITGGLSFHRGFSGADCRIAKKN